VLGTQRVNRAVLPHMRSAKDVSTQTGAPVLDPTRGSPRGKVPRATRSSSSSASGTPPYLAPYFAAKADMDALAVLYARELPRWGIETSIVVPGAFTKGTYHFVHSGRPADEARAAEYEAGPYKGFSKQVQEAFAAIMPEDADPGGVADLIVEVGDTPFGTRPFRVHYDPTQDGTDVGFTVLDRLRAEMLHRVGLTHFLCISRKGTPSSRRADRIIDDLLARRLCVSIMEEPARIGVAIGMAVDAPVERGERAPPPALDTARQVDRRSRCRGGQ
jgi:hypothetical protein